MESIRQIAVVIGVLLLARWIVVLLTRHNPASRLRQDGVRFWDW